MTPSPSNLASIKRLARLSGAIASVALITSLTPSDAMAFDYLEHSFFTDYACHHAQKMLAAEYTRRQPSAQEAARYIALGIYCPVTWEEHYCAEEVKQPAGHINLLDGPPKRGGKLSITLGDYAALPDHFARFGPIRNMPRAGDRGLWEWTAKWLDRGPDNGVGGVVEDVAEDACEDKGLPPWEELQNQIDTYLEDTATRGKPRAVAEPMLSPIARAPLNKGPNDPAGAYSFDNPHYLDLVLRNHNHFGVQAYSSWLGLHSAGVLIAGESCMESLDLSPRIMRRLTRDVPGYEDFDWSDALEASPSKYNEKACHALGLILEKRVRLWAERAPKEITAPVQKHLDLLLTEVVIPEIPSREEAEKAGEDLVIEQAEQIDALEAIEAAKLRDALTASIMSLVFEGSSLHFLQDGLAAGHLRTIRTRGGLQEARYDHDRDNAEGVVAILQTRSGRFPFVAFGDTYMLAPGLPGPRDCALDDPPPDDPLHVSNCLIAHQRGVLTAVSMASLLDWALGGTLYGVEISGTPEQVDGCASLPVLERFICAHLPSRATKVAGEEGAAGGDIMHHGSLPVPPPPFSYEALTTRIGFDVAGRAPQINVSFSLLTELDELANWLTSYRVGMTASLGDGVEEQWFADFAYQFHWRWSARFLIDAGASAYMGFRDFDRDATFFGGLSPVVGFTILPEGWVKLPLEFSISFRFPINFFDSKEGFFGDGPLLEGYWIYTGFGLAIMH